MTDVSQTRINPLNHPIWRATSHPFPYRSQWYGFGEDGGAVVQWPRGNKVTIGHGVWVGDGVTILPGVHIGTRAVIDAASMVTKDLALYTIVAGNPARPIRRRVSEEVEASLIEI